MFFRFLRFRSGLLLGFFALFWDVLSLGLLWASFDFWGGKARQAMPRKRLTHLRKSKEATCKPNEWLKHDWCYEVGTLENCQEMVISRDKSSIFLKMQTSVPPQYPTCWLERFAVGSLYVNHLVGSLYNLPRLMLMNSLNPSPQNIMLTLKKPSVDMVVIGGHSQLPVGGLFGYSQFSWC